MILIYVDDILVIGSNTHSLRCFTQKLNNIFSLKDLGSLHYFLGIEAYRDKSGIYLTQGKYISDLLDMFHMGNATPYSTPMAAHKSLSIHSGEPLENPSQYRSAVGALQYLCNTRPDISFCVGKLSQFLSKPTTEHWKAVKRVLRYLRGTIHYGIHIKPSALLDIVAYSDADWASCPDDRRSVGGYCVFFGDSIVSWSSKKQ